MLHPVPHSVRCRIRNDEDSDIWGEMQPRSEKLNLLEAIYDLMFLFTDLWTEVTGSCALPWCLLVGRTMR